MILKALHYFNSNAIKTEKTVAKSRAETVNVQLPYPKTQIGL